MNKRFDFLQMLKDGHAAAIDFHGHNLTKAEFLCIYIFEFTIVGEFDAELFASRAVDVAKALNGGQEETANYASDEGRLLWYLIMINMPFFKSKVMPSSRVQRAYWDGDASGKDGRPLGWFFVYSSTGLYIGHEQMHKEMLLEREEWRDFINAICEFYYEVTPTS